jgi:hypothetical protein
MKETVSLESGIGLVVVFEGVCGCWRKEKVMVVVVGW